MGVSSPSLLSSNRAKYHAYTLWLFTYNDLKTMVFPSTIFAFFHPIPEYSALPPHQWPIEGVNIFLSRLPSILAYTWFNLLAFVINNQCPTASAKTLGLISYPLALSVSMVLGARVTQSALLILFGYIYDKHGGDGANFLIRNMLNACGFASFASGALEVALQSSIPLPWLLAITAVVCTTVHTQDMYYQVGDSAAGRRTVPLVIGDGPGKWSIAVSIMLWSWLCPLYWASGPIGYVAPLVIGIWVSLRSLTRRSVKEDRVTFRIYSAWLVSIYSLPTYYALGTGY